MLESHWKRLLAVLDGEILDPLPSAFIIDSPWLPGWAGMTTMDYYVKNGFVNNNKRDERVDQLFA